MHKPLENYAFIDSQNLNLGVQDLGWKLDYKKFRIYLTELVLQTMIDLPHYSKAVIVTGDGDFHCLVKYLHEQGKLLKVLIPNRHKFSVLLRKAIPTNAFHYLAFVNDLRKRLEYTK
jgi:hypothetical protein